MTVDVVEEPAKGERHPSPIAQDVMVEVIEARGEGTCRLAIPVEELLGDTPYIPEGGS